MAEKVNGRIAFADLLRVFAVVAAIVLHVACQPMYVVPVQSSTWAVCNVYDSLVRWCAPVFVMLSGMFLLDPKHGLSLPRLFLHNGLRVFVALLFWGMVYAMVDLVRLGGRVTWSGIGAALLDALRGHTHYHLWFLYVILGLYLVTPILRAFVRGASRGDFHWFFLLSFLLASVLPMLFRLWPGSTAVLHTWVDNIAVQLVLGYVGYYVAGYYLKEYTIGRIAEALIYVLGIAGAFFTIWWTRSASLASGSFSEMFYSYVSPNVVLFSVAIVVLFRYVLGISEERSRRQRMGHTARLVFGIYLIHDLFLMLLNAFGFTAASFNPVVTIPLMTAVIFLCSWLLAWIISKIPLVGRWII